ncbi:MAG: FIST C-terminal domain-containing protein [Clostridiales Family XIII bacterium]|jgi:hypothetical protein|nr:FIST C-terminal domain-containing protein [Clostridiales Family XIII bacterium]
MKSAVSISFELDDVQAAADELIAGLADGASFGPDALGILYCDADVDGAALTGILRERLGFDVVGMTTLAALGPGGYNEMSSVLTVIAGEGVRFAVSVTPTLTGDTAADGIRAAYSEMEKNIGQPALLLLFPPAGMPFAGDVYPDTLAALAPGMPLLGGVASDDYDYLRARVFFSGRDFRDAAVLAGLAGEVHPRFYLRHVTSRFAERRQKVTESKGTTVYRVGDETFIEYLNGFGLRTDVDDPLLAFNSYPMMLTREGTDETPLMRHISGLNAGTGEGVFLGNVPAGTIANICLVNRDDILSSCRLSMEGLAADAAAGDAEEGYSLVLCISCCGRSMILGTESGAEGQILEELLPAGYRLAGAYCLGEFSPALYKDGAATNRFHNCSIVLCEL